MITSSVENLGSEEIDKFEADIPEVPVKSNETPTELSARFQAEVQTQTEAFSTELLAATQHSIEVIGPDPDINQQPEMVELMAELESLDEAARRLGKTTNQELASVIAGEVNDETLIDSPDSQDTIQTTESEPIRETPETVKQLIDGWKTEYDGCRDPDMKAELAYRMVKMGDALRSAHLNANEVGIQTLDGAAGFYEFNTKRAFITPAGIDTPEDYKNILVHESAHAGKMTGKRIADEGLTEIATTKYAGNTMNEVYGKEQSRTRDAATNMDIASILDSYDFDHPEELITLYLQTEWKINWEKIKSELQPNETLLSESGRNELMQNRLRTWAKSIEQRLQSGLPDLINKARGVGFSFDQTNAMLFQKLVDAEIGETKRPELESKPTE